MQIFRSTQTALKGEPKQTKINWIVWEIKKSDQVLKWNVTVIRKEWQAEIYQEALPGSPEQSAVLLKPKAHTAATLITQVSIETTLAACTGPEP